MALADGEGLDKRIARGAIPVDQSLGIAKQLAEALEAAHEKGISSGGGDAPRWGKDGKELFYLRPDGSFVAVAVTLGGSLQVGATSVLFKVAEGNRFAMGGNDHYDVSRDGQRFLINVLPSLTPVTMIVNWK